MGRYCYENNEVIAQSAANKCARSVCVIGRPTLLFMMGWAKILVQRRTETKDFQPGMLDATAGGVVQLTSKCWSPRAAKRKRSSALPACLSLTTASSTMRINIAASGAVCSAACHTGLCFTGGRGERSVLADAGRDHRPLRRVHSGFIKALALWMTRNANNESAKLKSRKRPSSFNSYPSCINWMRWAFCRSSFPR